MKRQAIAIGLDDLELLKKQINKELKEMAWLKFPDIRKIRILFPIVNYQKVESNGKINYCSDTWEFEILKGGKK